MDIERILASFENLVGFVQAMPHETSVLELKEQLVPGRDLAKDVAALANSAGGLVVLGVTDFKRGGVLVGVDVTPVAIDSLTAAISAMTYPPVELEAHTLRDSNGTTLVAIHVPRSRRGPHEQLAQDAHRFPARRGAHVKSLTLTELEQLQREASQSRAALVLIDRHNLFNSAMVVSMPTDWRGIIVDGRSEFEPASNFAMRGDVDTRLTQAVLAEMNVDDGTLVPGPFGLAYEYHSATRRIFSAGMSDTGETSVMAETSYLRFAQNEMDGASFAFEFALRWTDAALYGMRLGPRAIMNFAWRVDELSFSHDNIAVRVDFSRETVRDILARIFEHVERGRGRAVLDATAFAQVLRVRGGDQRVKWNAG